MQPLPAGLASGLQLPQRAHEYAERVYQRPHSHLEMNCYVIAYSQQTEKPARRRYAVITNVDLPLAAENDLTGGVSENVSVKNYKPLRAGNAQQTLHPNAARRLVPLYHVVGEREAYRGVLRRTERLKEVRVLKADATVE